MNLQDSEREQLQLFRERVTDLRHCSLLQGGGTLVLKVNPKLPKGLDGVSEAELVQVLCLLRQFMLTNELVRLDKVRDLIKGKCPRAQLVGWAEYALEGWNQTLDSRPLGPELHGKRYTVREAVDLLLYGEIIHANERNHDKARLMRSFDPIAKGWLRELVIVELGRLCQGANLIDLVIWHWLDAPMEPVPPVPDLKP